MSQLFQDTEDCNRVTNFNFFKICHWKAHLGQPLTNRYVFLFIIDIIAWMPFSTHSLKPPTSIISQSNQFPMNQSPTLHFFLVEYPVSLKNTSDYITKITCEEHDFNFIALYSHSTPTIVSFIKGLKDFHEILCEHLVLWDQHGSVRWPQREESTSTWALAQ